MNKNFSGESRFKGLKIAITGAKGSLGQSLIEELKDRGAYVVGLTHSKTNNLSAVKSTPDEWISWNCGAEKLLSSKLTDIDILILNHGLNPQGVYDSNEITKAIEINALSHWRFMQLFEDLALKTITNKKTNCKKKEIWINTSEAEIQIAFSPVYEITKRLIGQIVSLRKGKLLSERKKSITIKKLVLGPFKSKLNPIGIMTPDFVAKKIVKNAEKENYLIIVSPNPLTYILMPINEIIRIVYTIFITKIINKKSL